MIAKLAPCPFCGGPSEQIRFCSDHVVRCTRCFVSLAQTHEADAVHGWNRRADLGEMLAQAWRAADAARADLAEVTRQRDELLARLAEVVHGHTEARTGPRSSDIWRPEDWARAHGDPPAGSQRVAAAIEARGREVCETRRAAGCATLDRKKRCHDCPADHYEEAAAVVLDPDAWRVD